MTDNGDGTYTADYTVSQSGTVTVSAELLKAGGAHEYYFDNQNWSGNPSYSTVSEIYYDWGGSRPDDFSYIWIARIIAPQTGTYTFWCVYDDTCLVYIGGQYLMSSSGWGTISGTKQLTAGTSYDLKVYFS